jgi:hypothetical protein
MPTGNVASHFIDEPIEVFYDTTPLLEKKPTCPDVFKWGDEEFTVTGCIMEWVDYSRRGRMARNMSDAHSLAASTRGSWGVGRFYFRVQTTRKRTFDIYYDRSPKGYANRKGQWFVFREFVNEEKQRG